MRLSQRLVQHGCVALAALTLPVFAPRALSAAGHVRAALSPLDAAVQASAILERRATPPFTERPAQTVVAARGDTLASLAAAFHSDAAAIRWANGVADVAEPAPGTRLLIPPGPGALVRVSHDQSLADFAGSLNVDPRVLLDFNQMSNVPLSTGHYVQVPREVAPPGSLSSATVVPQGSGIPAVASTQAARGGDTFPWGQCTYYVATRRGVTWAGNAWTWFGNARAAGRPVGHVPVAGSIAVTWGSWVGHVAYVERVNPDGSFVVSEMNVRGVGVVDQRTLRVDSETIGFIY